MATLTLRSVKGTPLTVAELDANFTSLNNAYGTGNITTNVAIGNYALNSNSTGSNNTSIGVNALYGNTTGSYNLSAGAIAGRYIADGITSATILNNSTFIGYGTRASANNITNETVIGYNAIGSGSNSVTLGGSTVTKTIIPFGNVGIGTSSPNASAILDAQSTTKGVRMPNMTTTQKNAIASPAAGLVIFDTTLAKLCLYTGVAWQTITSV
jgi:hypothetical protein